MLFNSLQFLVFFFIVTSGYFLLPHRFRWAWLLAASCYFYMAFIPVYILILGITIVIDYFAGILIENTNDAKKKKLYLIASIISTCMVLFVFKYYNFFIDNFNAIANVIGWNYPLHTLKIILPIGLSFHTFQSLSYVVEVYRGHQKAERHFGIYALYVMFYPQLVAGPIERPQNLLWQFRTPFSFDYYRVRNGLFLMIWGLFKKVVVADRIAEYVNEVFKNPAAYKGLTSWLATYFFAVQIYCDFSGYSDIAIGSALVMGFTLMTNFRRPYFSQSIREFWSRWHISLSTWFKDYLYVPLGGNRVGRWRWYYNLFITFLVSGFWHGANWTFIIWGALHGFYLVFALITENLQKRFQQAVSAVSPHLNTLIQVLITFHLVCFAWIFFRADTLSKAIKLIKGLLVFKNFSVQNLFFFPADLWVSAVVIAILCIVDYAAERKPFLERYKTTPMLLRWAGASLILFAIFILGKFEDTDFIYFQF